MKSLEYSHLINVDTFLCPFGVCTREVRLPRQRERERERVVLVFTKSVAKKLNDKFWIN